MKTQSSSMIWTVPVLGLILLLAMVATTSSTITAVSQNESTSHKLTPPGEGRKIPVAFVLTEGATMIDFAGPWEVFQDTMTVPGDNMAMPFELYTVGESRNPIRVSGGMTVVPDYSFDDAPAPKIVVIPAQRGAPKMGDWLRRMDKQSEVVMSVCTGAFQLGKAGLLDGKEATTHHEFYDQFQKSFPKTKLVKGTRYVRSDDVVYTAGGLTSGIDLALHIVEKYYGRETALRTAKYMEYESTRWME